MNLLRKFQSLLRRGSFDAQMAEEMRLHVELQTDLNLGAGMSPEEARQAALRQFGNVASLQEQAREARAWLWPEQAGQDIRHGVRQLRKSPGFAAVAILTLAVGIGATTSIFSVVNGVLLRPLSYPESDRLVVLGETHPPDNRGAVASRGAYFHWVDHSSGFASIAAFNPAVGNLTGAGDAERVSTLRVTPNYFPTLGVGPGIGRDFRPEEATAGKANVAILSHPLWVKKFGARPEVIDQTIVLNDEVFTIIGILPPNRQLDAQKVGLYVPLTTVPADRADFNPRNSVDVIARLKPGVTLAGAKAEMTALAGAMAAQNQGVAAGRGVRLVPLIDEVVERTSYGMSGVSTLLLTLSGAVGFLLLIACANVANLLLARACTRRREIAMRATLGASRGRIIRQMLGESLLLAALGGGLGALLAGWSLGALKALAGNLPRVDEISIDGRVLAFSCLATIATGIVFGLVPALQATGMDLLTAVKNGGQVTESRQSRRWRGGLIVAEIALALVLLVGAGLLINSFIRLQRIDLGYRIEGIHANRIELPPRKYGTAAQQAVFVNEVVERAGRLPQVRAVAITNGLPIFGTRGGAFTIAGRPADPQVPMPHGLYAAVTSDYFKVMGISVLRGRAFRESDAAGAARVAVISEQLAHRYFPDQDPIGQRINITNGWESPEDRHTLAAKPPEWREIVGVVNDVRQWGPLSDTIVPLQGNLYEPFAQKPTAVLQLVVQATGDAPGLAAVLRSGIQSVDRNLPLNTFYYLPDGIDASIAKYRLSMRIFALFSGLAMLLAAIGIYGVIAYNVAERTGEIGIRMALGATPGDVLRLVFAEAGRLVGLGLLCGLAAALAATRLIQSLLFNVSGHDPLTLAAVATLLAGIAFLASWLPARRAAKVDPIIALRAE